ncbi:hypothetical protein HG536_0H02270 [Torulaspora globosa]|uniref:Pantoate--beta-alanine ligase n=1 Tax=Torulaspora globosa TaxID=48254 RepID=A0A7G3ZMW6_9SACH|nr:uncharacterized protein HG536_0H02270 [Torulaspora globosa]QLL34852.1 hypothetical protein HG536_0H02270 [Torulaspora globosa]
MTLVLAYNKLIERFIALVKMYIKDCGMKVAHTVQEVRNWHRDAKGSIGFVPTMGCLHAGHTSLFEQSMKDNDLTVVSIFVNPSQFGPNEDLDQYPRTLSEDIKLLEELGVDMLFAPKASEIYPQGIPLNVDEQRGPFVSVLGVSEVLEGATRPNFFRGVATVVAKLLNIVAPDVAYFGQKDIQQFIVLDTMVRQLFFNVRLQMMPIKRDSNGLALSSRNKYMSEETLQIASNIYKGLKRGSRKVLESNGIIGRDAVDAEIRQVWQPYVSSGDFEIDYLSIADFQTLKEVSSISPAEQQVVISCAIYVKDRRDKNVKVRLIDNILLG